MKQKLSLLLAVLMLVLCFAPRVSAAQVLETGSCGQSASYTLYSDGRLVITGTGAIANDAFAGKSNITTLEIVRGITAIGDNAFNACPDLASMTLPSTLKTIGAGAFGDCYQLTGTLVIPNSVTSLNGGRDPMASALGAFARCKSLTGVVFGTGLTAIPQDILHDCSNLRTVSIPEGITVIGDNAFSGCTSLTSVTLPSTLKTIGAAAFSDCYKLTGTMMIPNSVTSLNGGRDPMEPALGAFDNCTGLTGVVFGSGLTAIPYGTLSGCTNVRSVSLPEGITTIAPYAFSFCCRLNYVEIPAAVTEIGSMAFVNDFSLTNVVFKGSAPQMSQPFFCSSFNAVGFYPADDESWADAENLRWMAELTSLMPYATEPDGTIRPLPLDEQRARDNMSLLRNNRPAGAAYPDSYSYIINGNFVTGHGSEAFAFQVSDALCGFLPLSEKQTVDFTALNVGDILYLNGECCTVTAISGDSVTAAGVDADETIYYDRTLTRAQVAQATAVRARAGVVPYPGLMEPSLDFVLTDLPTTLPTEQEVYDTILALQATFPEGMPYSNKNGFHSKTTPATYEDNGVPMHVNMNGHGCSAFAYLVSDLCFGNQPARYLQVGKWDFEDLRVGDSLVGLGHQVIVLEVHGDHVVIVEGNYDETIHWGRTMTRQECLESFDLYTRYPVGYPFTDLEEGRYYVEPVLWAVEKGITAGITPNTFAPDDKCTRGQVVTFLWRAAGCPEPTSTSHPFTDINEKAYYYKAMLWAVENGITAGMTADTFAPDSFCSRSQVVTFLWRAAGKPDPTSTKHPFKDVNAKAYYYKAMLWAVENGITAGMTATTFAPDQTCSRGQVVTFLYRNYVS